MAKVCPSSVRVGGLEDYMQLTLSRMMVDNQDNALTFYAVVLGFVKKPDIPMKEFRWLTVVSPDGADGVELVLEPLAFPPAKTYLNAMFDAEFPSPRS
jgi:hypothetical protein